MSHSSRINAGPLSGGVTDTRATIKVSVMRGVETASLIVSPDPAIPAGSDAVPATLLWSDADKDYKYKIARFDLEGLTADTEYHYILELDGRREGAETQGRFRTFPPARQRTGFRFAFGSCSHSGLVALLWRRPGVYRALQQEPELRFFCHLGDLHYGNVHDDVITERLEHYDTLLQRRMPGRLLSNLPLVYCWDDHDFLGDNLEGGSSDAHIRAAARSARDAYDLYVPHYPLVNAADGIYQSFVIANVLFLMTDTRFNKSPRKGSGTSGKTMLGPTQKAWLKQQLLVGKEYDLIVWANSVPWIGDPAAQEDYWAGYANEREDLANYIKQHDIRNLCMISGDAHMLAIDDGRHAGFALPTIEEPERRGGFPVFHAAALESKPSEKGGVYSIGEEDGGEGKGIRGTGQYGLFEIRYPPDDAMTKPPHVYWTGKRVTSRIDPLALLVDDPEDSAVETVIQYDFPANPTYDLF